MTGDKQELLLPGQDGHNIRCLTDVDAWQRYELVTYEYRYRLGGGDIEPVIYNVRIADARMAGHTGLVVVDEEGAIGLEIHIMAYAVYVPDVYLLLLAQSA